MCSSIEMDNYQGDLTDIIRASAGAYGGGGGGGGADSSEEPISDWNFPSEPMNYSSTFNDSKADFGHPFSSVRDPLLHELDITSSSFLISSSNSAEIAIDKTNWPPSNIFSRLLQISPTSEIPSSPSDHSRSPSQLVDYSGQTKASASVSGDMINADNLDSFSSDTIGMQISSPPNTIGIKRRKSQAKKVLCIPAPAAANSRQSGEVVPSDLWAWRKYGQKPIKGSPYPRGYYRCSSSKGCSARKQVERSRNDPNMLVITYTSEHNHPWPTQRNALAGSSRTPTSKTGASSKSSSSSYLQNPSSNEEQKEISNSDDGCVSTTSTSVKDESDDFERGLGFDESEGFFEDLEELERDPLDVLLNQGFNGDSH